jgi:hypothetical protein
MQYYLVVAPAKHVVYSDKLPPGRAIARDRPIVRLLAALTPEVRSCVIYPAGVLRDGRRTGETYFHTDTHWTDYGGYLASVRLRDRMRFHNRIPQDAPEIALERTPYRRIGDLGSRMAPQRAETATRITPANDSGVRRIFASGTETVEVFERPEAAGLRGVMFGDAYGRTMLPFLLTDFRRLVAVAAESLFYDLLRSEKPDVVITQIAEQALCEPDPSGAGRFRLPDDFPPVDFPGFSGVALPLVSDAAPAAASTNIIDLDFTNRPAPVWSDGECTEMVLKCRVPYASCELVLTASAFVQPPQVTAQRLDVAVNGTLLGSFMLGGETETIVCPVPLSCLFSGRTLRVELFHPDCVSPQSLGMGTNAQEISLRFQRLVVRPAV